jgi:hypothetical protein
MQIHKLFAEGWLVLDRKHYPQSVHSSMDMEIQRISMQHISVKLPSKAAMQSGLLQYLYFECLTCICIYFFGCLPFCTNLVNPMKKRVNFCYCDKTWKSLYFTMCGFGIVRIFIGVEINWLARWFQGRQIFFYSQPVQL